MDIRKIEEWNIFPKEKKASSNGEDYCSHSKGSLMREKNGMEDKEGHSCSKSFCKECGKITKVDDISI